MDRYRYVQNAWTVALYAGPRMIMAVLAFAVGIAGIVGIVTRSLDAACLSGLAALVIFYFIGRHR